MTDIPDQTLLDAVPDDLCDEELNVDELGSRIVGLAGRLAAATCRWLVLVAAFDARHGAAQFGLPTTARWLMHYCGVSRRTAIEHVRVARSLAVHPAMRDAMSSGRLSYSHVRAVSRIVGVDPAAATLVSELVQVAEHGTVVQLESMVRGLRTVEHAESAGEDGRPVDTRYVRRGWDHDSRWRMSTRLDPEEGALVQAAIETVAEAEGVTQVQALVRMAEIALTVTAAGSSERRTLRGDERAAVVVHLDAAAVPADPELGADPRPSSQPDSESQKRSAEHPRPRALSSHAVVPGLPFARIAQGPGLPDAVVKRLVCAGRIRVVAYDGSGSVAEGPTAPGGSVLDLGRTTRLVSDRQFRALSIRDGGCAHPGCGSRYRIEAHHVRHWLHGGRTDMANLVLLCQPHHLAHHEGEFSVTPQGRGRFRFHRADGYELPRTVDPSLLTIATRLIEAEYPHIDETAATTRWDGSHLDHRYAIAALARHLPSASRADHDPWAAGC